MNEDPGLAARSPNGSPHAPHVPDKNRARLMRRAAGASVAVATLLVGAKALAYIGTESVAVLGALADSAADLVASLGILFAVRQALTPADSDHRFGHGKAEPLISLAQSLFIAGSATFLLAEAVRHFLSPGPVANPLGGVAVILFSMAVTAGLVLYQRRTIRATGSLAIAADSAHYAGDLLTNLGAIVALLMSAYLGWQIADPIIGFAIAGVLYLTAWSVLRRSLDQLMDRELPEDDREHIKMIVLGHHRVKGMHDLRTRAAGTQSFIQIHVEMDSTLNLAEAHEASDEIEKALRIAFPQAEIIIHLDPHGSEEPPVLALS
jgi:ferrous-iron efflux pump FieF